MLLKSYRYKHEKICQGSIEGRPIRAKAKPKPKAQPILKPVHQEEETCITPPVQNNIVNPPPVNPITSLTQHYQILQQEYIKQKQQKYNSLCEVMFESRGKKKR